MTTSKSSSQSFAAFSPTFNSPFEISKSEKKNSFGSTEIKKHVNGTASDPSPPTTNKSSSQSFGTFYGSFTSPFGVKNKEADLSSVRTTTNSINTTKPITTSSKSSKDSFGAFTGSFTLPFSTPDKDKEDNASDFQNIENVPSVQVSKSTYSSILTSLETATNQESADIDPRYTKLSSALKNSSNDDKAKSVASSYFIKDPSSPLWQRQIWR